MGGMMHRNTQLDALQHMGYVAIIIDAAEEVACSNL